MFNKDNKTQCTWLSLELKEMQNGVCSHSKTHVAVRKIQMTLYVMLQNDFQELD